MSSVFSTHLKNEFTHAHTHTRTHALRRACECTCGLFRQPVHLCFVLGPFCILLCKKTVQILAWVWSCCRCCCCCYCCKWLHILLGSESRLKSFIYLAELLSNRSFVSKLFLYCTLGKKLHSSWFSSQRLTTSNTSIVNEHFYPFF